MIYIDTMINIDDRNFILGEIILAFNGVLKYTKKRNHKLPE